MHCSNTQLVSSGDCQNPLGIVSRSECSEFISQALREKKRGDQGKSALCFWYVFRIPYRGRGYIVLKNEDGIHCSSGSQVEVLHRYEVSDPSLAQQGARSR